MPDDIDVEDNKPSEQPLEGLEDDSTDVDEENTGVTADQGVADDPEHPDDQDVRSLTDENGPKVGDLETEAIDDKEGWKEREDEIEAESEEDA